MKPSLLVLIALTEASLAEITAAFDTHAPVPLDVLYAPDDAQRNQAIESHGAHVRAVLTNGTTGLTAAEIDCMPALEITDCP